MTIPEKQIDKAVKVIKEAVTEAALCERIRFHAMTRLADEAQQLANDIYEHQGLTERPERMADMPRPTIPQIETRIEEELELVILIATEIQQFKQCFIKFYNYDFYVDSSPANVENCQYYETHSTRSAHKQFCFYAEKRRGFANG